jgi:hypothetical protein
MGRNIPIGREFRCRMQEESKRRNTSVSARFIDGSETLQRFRADALAIDEHGYRIPGKNPQVLLEDCSIREMAAQTIVNRRTGEPVGLGFIAEFFGPDEFSRDRYQKMRLQEAGEISAIDWTMFAGITGPMLYNATLTGFEHEQFVLSRIAGTYPTQFITGERLPGVAAPYTDDTAGLDTSSAAASVQGQEDLLLKVPGKEFALATLGENYVDLPATELRGLRIAVERTAIYTDRVGLIASAAARVGEILGTSKEQRGLRALIGTSGETFKEKMLFDSGPVTIDPYQAGSTVLNSGTGQLAQTYASRKFPFTNDITDNPLESWENFKTSDIAFSKVTDPNNGLPLTLGMQGVIVPWSQRLEVPRILQAYNVWKLTASTVSGGVFGDGSINTVSPNPLAQMGNLEVLPSRMIVQEMIKSGLYAYGGAGALKDPEKVWFTGDFKEGLKYMQNWPIKLIQAPPNFPDEFTHDIVLQYRADERGKWAWFNPRLVQRNNYIGTQG